MVVDDERDILRVLEKGLENNGFKVVAFSDPLKALAHFKNNSQSIDLLVSDTRMAGMSGFQLAKMVKKIREDVRVILISAFEINAKELAMVMPSSHIDGFLTKPFLVSDLLEAIRK